MSLRSTFRKLRRQLSRYTPLVEVSISEENLLHNLHTYQAAYPDMKFAPVLKSNAYGHDIGLVARLLDRQKIAFFMVDSYYEAKILRRAGVHSRILVMGYVRPEDIARAKLPNIDFGITDLEQLRALTELVRTPLRIHLKLDTGMHRQGIQLKDLSYAEDLIKGQELLTLVGICSHFADADSTDETFSRNQIEVWQEMAKELLLAFPSIEYRHIAATKGVRFGKDTGTNVARLGIGLYGFDTSPSTDAPLRPVLELRSIIASVRDIEEGESVGYNATYRANYPMKIATVPLGYYEGIDRRLSNKGSMLVDGIVCPIIGRVSMNMTSIDVSNVPNVAPGDPVIAISRNPDHRNSVSSIAELVSTPEYRESEYVILTHVAQHLGRVVE